MTLAAAFLALALATGASPAPPSNATLRVILADCTDSKPVAGAHVTILARNGKLLAEGVTNDSGQVDLARPTEQADPALILAEHPRFFIGGVRWDPGFEERFIFMAWLGGL